jgi:PKD repeat protein
MRVFFNLNHFFKSKNFKLINFSTGPRPSFFGASAPEKIKRALLAITLIASSSFSGVALADEHWAASLKPADVQAAVNAASPGDTVVLPAGDYSGFNTSVDVYARISIRGQGKNATILRKTSTTGGFASGMFRVAFYHDNPRNQMVNSDVQFHDFSLYGMGGYDQTTEDTGFEFNDIQYGTTNIQFYNLGIYRFGNAGIQTSGWPFTGVVYNCDFGDCYLPGLGYGVSASFSKGGNESVEGITAYQAPVNWGGPDWLFIEDCTFTNCRHCINGSIGGRFVARYNDMTPKAVTNYSDAAICAHGTAHTNDTATVYGTSAMDIYNNTFHINLSTGAGIQWIWQVGGAIRAHDNVILGVSGTSVETQIWDPSDPITYPHPFMTTGLYYWDNTFDGVQRDPHLYNDYNEVGPGKVWQPNRDYFFYMPSGYTTYPYPHPLRQVAAHMSLSPTSLQFSAIVGGSQPPNQTFQVSNTGERTLNWSISDNASWLTCSPTSGTNGAAVTVSVDQTGLSAGSYSANISVSSTNADNSPQNLLVTFALTNSPPPLLASVIGSPSSGQAPLTVNFTGGASGGITPYTFRWIFGDGSSSASQSPSHIYSLAGGYTATLTVTDSQPATDSKSLAISVSAAPSPLFASASANPTSGVVPLSVSFTGGATGGTSPYSYAWNFGDGQSSPAQNPSHTYSAAGVFSAVLGVTDSKSTKAQSSVTIKAGSISSLVLTLSAQTGPPAPGAGGTTEPSPGQYSYLAGSTVPVRAMASPDYRFSDWQGDSAVSNAYSSNASVIMDKNKSLSAVFCAKCGDVNGDLYITPKDAQEAFDIFLGKKPNASWCERENADVNCSGKKDAPEVTPGDAQAIFNKYLMKSELPSGCSGVSRSQTLTAGKPRPASVGLLIREFDQKPLEDSTLVDIVIDAKTDINSFGFDLIFPSNQLTFIGVQRTDITKDFDQVETSLLGPALLRVGGYKVKVADTPSVGPLVTLIFRTGKGRREPGSIAIIATYDDLENPSITSETVPQQPAERDKTRSVIKGKG